MRGILKKPVFHCILIAALGLIAYSNTFNVPFQWDEDMTIVDNPIVKDLRYFLHPSEAKGFGNLYYSFRDRYMGYLTFALNYKFHGLNVRDYHVVNIALHIFNAMLVYALIRLTLSSPFLSRSSIVGHSSVIALFVSLIFVSHPIQTEAVTYIMGRLPLLMWFFYLSSMALYAKWRLTPSPNPLPQGEGARGRVILYLLSLLCAVFAMKTKENAFTLPFSIALYEFMFFPSRNPLPHPAPLSLRERVAGGRVRGYRLLYLAPFALTLLIIPLSLLSFDKPVDEVIGSIESASRHYTATPRMNYLFTQFRVLVTYLRLLFLPVNQNFDYDYPVYNSFFNLQVLISFMFLLSIFSLGAYFLIHSRRGRPALRLIAWGIFWFFLTLSVESSIFPIPMIISEYRLYAPLVGILFAVTTRATLLLSSVGRAKIKKTLVFAAAILPLIYTYAAYERNSAWSTKIILWEDVVRKSPNKARGHYNLGNGYYATGLIDKAIKHFQTAVKIEPSYAEAHNNLGNAYRAKGLYDKALSHYLIALRFKKDYADPHNNLGFIFYSYKGNVDKAIEHYEAALNIEDNATTRLNLGIAYKAKGIHEKATLHLNKAREMKPDLFQLGQ